MQKKSKEFFNLFMKEGNEIEKEFQREGMNEAQIREKGLTMVYAQNSEVQEERSSIGGNNNELRQSSAGFSYISKQFTKTKRRVQAKKTKDGLVVDEQKLTSSKSQIRDEETLQQSGPKQRYGTETTRKKGVSYVAEEEPGMGESQIEGSF